jgi:hypothetical protein
MKNLFLSAVLALTITGCGELSFAKDNPKIGYNDFRDFVITDSITTDSNVYEENIIYSNDNIMPYTEYRDNFRIECLENGNNFYTDITDYEGSNVYVTLICSPTPLTEFRID